MPHKEKYHLIYPHQLFEQVLSFPKQTVFLVVEDPLFFGDKRYPRNFHKQKIVLHRASMRAFAGRLTGGGFKVRYFDYQDYPDPAYIARHIGKRTDAEITVYDPTDYVLEKRLRKAFASSVSFSVLETPNFLTPLPLIREFFRGKKRFLMNAFYIQQRKRLGILLENDGPTGGSWSYDTENRKRLPKDIRIPVESSYEQNEHVKEAIRYANRHFPKNPGNAEEFDYPVDHAGARAAMGVFLRDRLGNFGAYEDAIAAKEPVIFHSKLSAPLNIGLLSPAEVVKQALERKNHVPLASLEGFVRQIIGWREFMRAVYILRGSQMRQRNFLKHRKKLPVAWYQATIGVEPIDATIRKVLRQAYCHHIERLMILGNFMLLLRIDPDDVYGWFMDLFIDAYDWVMVPNVYAMSQFADGGTITTKPYFSSSNYVLRMSDYQRGDWCTLWDDLFYDFLEDNRKLISANHRLSFLLKNLDRRAAKKSEKNKRIYDQRVSKRERT